MSKKSNKRTVSAKYNGPMTGGMKFFLAGCFAQLYLLIIRRFYINGTLDQVLAWDAYLLKAFTAAGAVAAVAGLAVLLRRRANCRALGWYLLGGGAFMALSTGLVIWNMNALSLLISLVPVVLVLDVLWFFFDRDSSLALTALAGALVVVWVCRRGAMGSAGLALKGAAAVYLAVLAVLVVLLKSGKLSKCFPAGGHKMIYTACALSALGVAAALVSPAAAYYAMWGLAAVAFCMAVYYTVRQL